MHSCDYDRDFCVGTYGADLKAAERARASEHEVLLQVPMELFDYPDTTRPQIYHVTHVGAEYRSAPLADEPLSGLCRDDELGSRFTASEQGLTPVRKGRSARAHLCGRRFVLAQCGRTAYREPQPALR